MLPSTFTNKTKFANVARSPAQLCGVALELASAGKFTEALDELAPLLKGVGGEPQAENLPPEIAAELYLCAGILTTGAGRGKEAQRLGRRYLRRAVQAFASVGNRERVARCVKEFASNCQRAGRHSHARRVAQIGLGCADSLALDTEASLHLISANAEMSLNRFRQALDTLEYAYPIFEAVTDNRIRGAFHNTLGLALKNLGLIYKIDDYLQRAIIEFTAAGYHFERADNISFLTNTENNLGLLLSALGEHSEAYPHLSRARMLALSTGDEIKAAQIDDTLARVMSAHGMLHEAEEVVETAINVLHRLGAVGELEEAFATRAEIIKRLAARNAGKSNVLPFTPSLKRLPTRFVVTVSDDSLINAGINAGDDLWLCRTDRAEDGELVFAVTPECMVLGFYYSDDDTATIVFAGDGCPELHYPMGRVRICGVAMCR